MSVASQWDEKLKRAHQPDSGIWTAAQLESKELLVRYPDLRALVDDALEFERTAERVQAVMPGVFEALAQAKTESEKLYERLAKLERDLQLAQQRVQAANAQLAAQAEHQSELETELTRMVERDYFEHKALFAQAVSRCVDAAASCLPPTGTDGWHAAQRTIIDRIAALEFDP